MPMRGSYREERLDNGVVLIVDSYPSALAAVVVGIGVGPLFEPKDKRGYSHLLEHMLFNVSGFDVDKAVESLGGETNAFTHRSMVVLTFQALAEGLGGLIEITSRILTNRKYEEARFEKEKQVVLSEIRMSKEDPSERIGDLGLKSLFGDSPWGEPIGGLPEVVSAATLRDLVEFEETWIKPDNIVVALTGRVGEAEAAKARAELSKLSGEAPRRVVPEMGRGPLTLKETGRGIDGAYYSYAVRLSLDDAYLRLNAAAFHLASGTKSILFETLRDRGLAYSYYVDFDSAGRDGFLQVVVESTNDLEAAREAVRDVLNRSWTPPPYRLRYFAYEWNKNMEVPLNRAYAYVEAKMRGINPAELEAKVQAAVGEGLAAIPRAASYSAEAYLVPE
ncbi:MAG: pitrilysin family protein [Thermoproteus sp.]